MKKIEVKAMANGNVLDIGKAKDELIQWLIRLSFDGKETMMDSWEGSTPARGGGVKVYVNFNNVEEAKQKIKNAVEIRAWANELIEQPQPAKVVVIEKPKVGDKTTVEKKEGV
jgi:hypothetical protein